MFSKSFLFFATIDSFLTLSCFIVCSNLVPSPEESIVALAMISWSEDATMLLDLDNSFNRLSWEGPSVGS